MAIIAVDNAHATLMLQNDAQQLRTFIQWVNARYQAYNQNLSTTAQMTTAGIAAGDQATVTAFIGDLNRLSQLMSGTLPTTATNMSFDLQAVIGVL